MEEDLRRIHFQCGRCSKRGDQRIVATYTHLVEDEVEQGIFLGQEYVLRLSLCSACDNVNLTVSDEDEEMLTVLWPTQPKELDGLPENVATAYKAARAVREIDANAFAVLLGRVLELICLDRGAVGNSLSNQLQDLANKGEIPGRLADMAHQLRALRNIGAHASLGDLTRAEVPVVDELCRAILEYVYTAPSRIAKVEQRIQQLKKRGGK